MNNVNASDQQPTGQTVAVATTLDLPWDVQEVRLREMDGETGPLWTVEGKTGVYRPFQNLFTTDDEGLSKAIYEAFQRALSERR